MYRWSIGRSTRTLVGFACAAGVVALARVIGVAWSEAILMAAVAITPGMLLVDRLVRWRKMRVVR
jgi:uncharacterized protein involved in response to NO